MASDWYVLFDGQLTDAPGRNESWQEQVRYMGSSRWHLRSVGSGFCGGEPDETYHERMGTKAMVHWVNDRDYEDREVAAQYQQEADGSAEIEGNVLGPRGVRLKDVARTVGADLCVDLLERWEQGTWPKAPTAPRIKEVLGVTKRVVWIRTFRVFYRVSTTQGDGFLSPPSEDGRCRLKLATKSSFDQGWQIKPSRQILGQLAAFKEEFQRLSDKESR